MSRIAQDLDQLGHRPLPWARSIPNALLPVAPNLLGRVFRAGGRLVWAAILLPEHEPRLRSLMTDDGNGTGLQAARSRFDGGSELPFSKEAILLNRNASRYGVRISSE